MANYEVTMQHSEKTFVLLAKKQYDLFCQTNRIIRTMISAAAIGVGLWYMEKTWAILLIGYGCYLLTTTYTQANMDARKMSDYLRQNGMSYPSSRYTFKNNYMEIVVLPEQAEHEPQQLKYKDVERLGEDGEYFYIFRDSYGGYMVPKAQLGKRVDDFRNFLERSTGQYCQVKAAPLVKLLRMLNSPVSQRRRK